MNKSNSNRAILVLESPWELDDGDANRSSVLPFVEGIAKYAGDMEVFHANFYDKESFIKALDCLCKTRFKNTLVYISAHGYKKNIGDALIGDLMFLVGEKSRTYNITGIMLGSCFVGENTTAMEVYIEGTNVKWCAGYSSSSEWLMGTMIDCAIMSMMSGLKHDDFGNGRILIDSLGKAIAPFSMTYPIGEDYMGNDVCLENSLQFVVQPAGSGNRAKTQTIEVAKKWAALQMRPV